MNWKTKYINLYVYGVCVQCVRPLLRRLFVSIWVFFFNRFPSTAYIGLFLNDNRSAFGSCFVHSAANNLWLTILSFFYANAMYSHTRRNHFTPIEISCAAKKMKIALSVNERLNKLCTISKTTRFTMPRKKCNSNAHLGILWSVDYKVAETKNKSQTLEKFLPTAAHCIFTRLFWVQLYQQFSNCFFRLSIAFCRFHFEKEFSLAFQKEQILKFSGFFLDCCD